MKTLASISAPDAERSVPADRIGPNAAIQLIAALQRRGETVALTQLFCATGLEAWLTEPPGEMIAASDAARLHVGLRQVMPEARAAAVLTEAGRLTGDYLLAYRIPKLAQGALKALPARISAKLLLRAIAAHAWTFAGDGRFEADSAGSAEIRIFDNPLCAGLIAQAPSCVWHAAVLQRLFGALVSSRCRVEESLCCARGDRCCRFRLTWSPPNAPPRV